MLPAFWVEALNSMSVTSRCSVGTNWFLEKTKFLIASMFFAEWISLSSEYPHSQTYVLSFKLTLCFLLHFGHHLVVGIHLSRMIVWGRALSFAFISPKQLCYTYFPNNPLCQFAICSSCMTIVEYVFRLLMILFALSIFLFESLRYSLWISLIVLCHKGLWSGFLIRYMQVRVLSAWPFCLVPADFGYSLKYPSFW